MLATTLHRITRAMHVAWATLREWSGDDAYDRYVARHRDHSHSLLTRRQFYAAYFDERGRRPRCC